MQECIQYGLPSGRQLSEGLPSKSWRYRDSSEASNFLDFGATGRSLYRHLVGHES